MRVFMKQYITINLLTFIKSLN